MIIEIIGYLALIASVTGSTLVFLEDRYCQFAFLLWCFSNPIFIYFAAVGYSVMRELYFVAFSIMFFTAIYGFLTKRRVMNNV